MRRSACAATVLALFGLAGCVSSGGQDRIAPGQSGVSSMRIDVGGVSGSYDLRMVEDISPVEDTVGAPVDLVWEALPRAYLAMEIPLESVNAEARLLGNDGFRARGRLGDERISRFIHCGRRMTGDIADRSEVYFTILSQVRAVEGTERSRVVSLVDATVRPSSTSGNSVRCSSTGRMEDAILTRLRLNLAGIDGGG